MSDGLEWDDGNWPKCGKHGLTKAAIESVFKGEVFVFDDPYPARRERRHRAVGKADDGRYVFVVFTLRKLESGQALIRPISARYMHRKEIEHYERQKENKSS